MSQFTESYNRAYNKSMSHEGQYSNDPRDRGGETWKGIARKMHPQWEGWAIIDQIKRNVITSDLSRVLRADEKLEAMVQTFYKAEFFDRLLLDQVKEQSLIDELFDTAINQGLFTSSLNFQKALNLLNNNQKHYSDLKEDGKLGPATLKAYNAYMLTSHFPARSQERNVSTLLKVLNGLQFERYKEICEASNEQEVYFYGWLNRV
jgi:lysozyme family protein